MMYYGHGMGIGWIPILAVVLAALLAAAALIGTQLRRPPREPSGTTLESSAERLLAERFARGEIDAEEYERRLSTLRSPRARA
ncbi:SHOCT domain-containing protein [Actinoplanes sp. NPDC049265]|uniref:SHOCT domain-containing protein n=1 Tax=Actinoplanes sp. NPDC049265 TaxID=3363902 RepID=UPI003714856C